MGYEPQDFSFTTLSSKGQVVLPAELRDKLHLETGMRFQVALQDDVIQLKLQKSLPHPIMQLAASLQMKRRAKTTDDDVMRYVAKLNGVGKKKTKTARKKKT